jgi:mono/diheme cytochrome c family protein
MAQKKKTSAPKKVAKKVAAKKVVVKRAAVDMAAPLSPAIETVALSSSESASPKLQTSKSVSTEIDLKVSNGVECEEPALVGDRGLPMWLMFILGLMVLWGDLYFVGRGGGFDSKVYTPYKNVEQLDVIAASRDPEKLFIMQGRNLFNKNCAVCHQESGLGQAGLYPPLAGSDWVNGVGPNRMIRIALNGLVGPVDVLGTTYNNTMVGLGAILSDSDIAAILSYVRTNDVWGNSGAKVTPEAVAAVRASEGGRSAQWTADEILATPHSD